MMEETVKKTAKKKGKINKLFSKITIYLSISIVFLILFLLILDFYSQKRATLQQEINVLEKQNASISAQISDIINKSIAAKTYIKIWNEEFSKEQKELKGINTTNTYAKILEIAKDSKLVNVSVNFSPLILASGAFEKQNIKVFTTAAVIKFSTITDIDVLNFLDNLKRDLGCFVIVQDMSLKRTRKIDDEFIKMLNTGNVITAVDGEIRVRLYGLEAK